MKVKQIVKVVFIVGGICWLIAIVGLIADSQYDLAGTIAAAPFVGLWKAATSVKEFVVSLFTR
jgi:hypothetical protein